MSILQLHRSSNRDRILMRLVWLRTIVLTAAALVILVYQFYFHKTLPYVQLYAVLVLASVFSAGTLALIRARAASETVSLLVQLLVDMGIVIVLVAFSGRSGNPFIYYLLVPVAIGATLLSLRLSWMLTLLAVLAYTLLLYLDLQKHIHHLSEFQLHLFGMWVNFVGSAVLINVFVSNLAMALRDREAKLAAAREQTLKNEQIIGIGTLAASTAHALGTPLSTMAVVLGEMKAGVGEEDENVRMLLAQITRCKQTLSRLSQLAEAQNAVDNPVIVRVLAGFLIEHYQLMNPKVMPQFAVDDSASNALVSGNVLLQHALINLIDNAINASRSRVCVEINRDADQAEQLHIAIIDDGPGLAEEELDAFGKPTVSRNDGMGIGVFLANSTIEKLSGEIVLYNPDKSLSGETTVIVRLPLFAGEANGS